jgi:hemerythrin
MMAVKWSTAYSVGVEEIDIQHRGLFEIVNNFLESADTRDEAAIEKLLIRIVEFTD